MEELVGADAHTLALGDGEGLCNADTASCQHKSTSLVCGSSTIVLGAAIGWIQREYFIDVTSQHCLEQGYAQLQKELPPSYSIYIPTRATLGTVILLLKSWPCRCQCSHRPEEFILDLFRIWHVLIPAKAALAGGGVCYLHRPASGLAFSE